MFTAENFHIKIIFINTPNNFQGSIMKIAPNFLHKKEKFSTFKLITFSSYKLHNYVFYMNRIDFPLLPLLSRSLICSLARDFRRNNDTIFSTFSKLIFSSVGVSKRETIDEQATTKSIVFRE